MSNIFENRKVSHPLPGHVPALSTFNSATSQRGGCLIPTFQVGKLRLGSYTIVTVPLTKGLPDSSQLHKKESLKDQPETAEQIPDTPYSTLWVGKHLEAQGLGQPRSGLGSLRPEMEAVWPWAPCFLGPHPLEILCCLKAVG